MKKSSTIMSTQEEMILVKPKIIPKILTEDSGTLHPQYWYESSCIDAYNPNILVAHSLKQQYELFSSVSVHEKIKQIADCPVKTTAALVADTPVSDDPPANPEAACSYSSFPIVTSRLGLMD
ncbi:unnamed protein product [Malus baccata var. baccata]